MSFSKLKYFSTRKKKAIILWQSTRVSRVFLKVSDRLMVSLRPQSICSYGLSNLDLRPLLCAKMFSFVGAVIVADKLMGRR
ncbi:hypothetical protein CEXT_27961 [Caerostris extrusa]|uniref:Uncharacterized protein n=1 Tax=Caerostris extrusa TaxID=172846 RepID=A0AAV4MSA4_CAEEX|nr:hypothetical protein CEXT_27961 [Caerostris extrusa]